MKYILFDLDGTLLPMNDALFTNALFNGFAKEFENKYPYPIFMKTLFNSLGAMVKNDGNQTNQEAFWNCFENELGGDRQEDEKIFMNYYTNKLETTKKYCGFTEKANSTIKTLKDNGYKIILATNPLFPRIAQLTRIGWAGLDYRDFECITSYEFCHHCKPNVDYYREIVKKFDIDCNNTYMVGNDVNEDMIAQSLGFKVFLMPRDLLNKSNKDISIYPQGDFDDLLKHLNIQK